MFNYRPFFKISAYLTFMILVSCSPFSEESTESSVVELEYNDSTTQQHTEEPQQAVIGNMAVEIQEDATTNRKSIFMKASFFMPELKNPLFLDVPTELLKKTIFEALPEEQPCGIPGFPDCPNPAPIANK